MPRATKDSVSKYRLKLPSLQDQQLIAEYFSQLDERIRLENERLELVKLEQKILLEKIFTTW